MINNLTFYVHLYHKYIYGRVAGLTSSVTDTTDLAFSDAILGMTLIYEETLALLLLGGVAGSFTHYNSGTLSEAVGDATTFLISASMTVGAIGAYTSVNYLMNHLRTPLPEHLDIKESDFDRDEELQYTIENLNRLSGTERLFFDQANTAINEALDNTLEEMYGYTIPFAKKTKRSLFSRWLLRRDMLGMMNPFFQEIVVTTSHSMETLAHEKAHLAGFPREIDAQLMGYIVLQTSEDPYLNYLGYAQRLDMLMDDSDRPLYPKDLRDLGLNERTIQEIVDRETYLFEQDQKTSRYTQLKNSAQRYVRGKMLSWTHQGVDPEKSYEEHEPKEEKREINRPETSITAAYISRPLRLISAFDPPVELNS